jgi:two-component system chemotaxis response regulator CheB
MIAHRKRVLIIDDSVFARKIVSDILASSPELQVVGTATDGREGLRMIEALEPDVVTLDVEMPGLDGIQTLEAIMRDFPTPVVMLSSLTVRGARESVTAFRLGAVDVMAKPHGTHSIGLTAQADELIAKVAAAAHVVVAALRPVPTTVTPRAPAASVPAGSAYPIVIIASSTGGPRALRGLVPELTADAGAAYAVVQHLPEGFSAAFAHDINSLTDLNVREAEDGDTLRSGDVLFAKSGWHLVFDRSRLTRLTRTAPLWGVRPSADATMASAAPVFGSRLIGVVLTGMGRDGANGLRLIKEVGGITVAEDESTCIVYGMPRAAIEEGVVDIVAPLDKMAEAIRRSVRRVAQAHQEKAA